MLDERRQYERHNSQENEIEGIGILAKQQRDSCLVHDASAGTRELTSDP